MTLIEKMKRLERELRVRRAVPERVDPERTNVPGGPERALTRRTSRSSRSAAAASTSTSLVPSHWPWASHGWCACDVIERDHVSKQPGEDGLEEQMLAERRGMEVDRPRHAGSISPQDPLERRA